MTVDMSNYQKMSRMIPEHQLNIFSIGYGVVTASLKSRNASSILQVAPQTDPGKLKVLHSIVKTE